MIAIGMIVKTLKNVVSRFNGWSGYSMSSWTGWSSVIAAPYGGRRRRASVHHRGARGQSSVSAWQMRSAPRSRRGVRLRGLPARDRRDRASTAILARSPRDLRILMRASSVSGVSCRADGTPEVMICATRMRRPALAADEALVRLLLGLLMLAGQPQHACTHCGEA